MFGLELVILVLVAVIAGAVERSRRKKRVDHDLDAWARDLGMVRVGNELFAQRGDLPVGARLAFDSPHGTKVQARWTLYARIQPPLDMGLLISNQLIPVDAPGAGHAIVRGFGAAFERRFNVRCDEPVRAQTLLTPAVRQSMMRNLHRNAMCMVTDGGVAVQTVHGLGDEATLERGLEAVSDIANTILTSRAYVPPARALAAHRTAWQSFATSNGLQGISAPLCMFGTIEDATVYAYSVRVSAGELHLEVWMRFEEPLALGLLIQPMRTLDRMKDMFGAADHKLGDPLFDETFLVRVSDGHGAERLFDEDTRKRLLVIHDTVGPLSLTDDGLSVRLPHVPPDPAVVPKIVRQMLEMARFISDKRRGQRDGGPYR